MRVNNIAVILFGFFFVSILILSSSVFIVERTEQAIVLQFGKSKSVHVNPGLKFKVPFIQEVLFYDARVLDFDLPPVLVTTIDQKRLVVDTYTRYKINDPLLFFQTIQPSNETGARMRLEGLIGSALRNVLGKVELRTMLSTQRSNIMKQVEEEVKSMSKPLGIEIVDVRIIRTDLPLENKKAVLARMNAELERFAKENRTKGVEMAQKIKATADKERTFILAEANKQSEIIRGEAEAKAIDISNKIYGKDPSFYSFYRWLQTYRTSFSNSLNIVLGSESSLLKILQNPNQIVLK